jgi:hypothetical protein
VITITDDDTRGVMSRQVDFDIRASMCQWVRFFASCIHKGLEPRALPMVHR